MAVNIAARVLWAALCLGTSTALAQPHRLAPQVEQALQRARVPTDAVAVVVEEAGSGATRLALNAQAPFNPASLFKLFTTTAALELLGPAWRWRTPVWLDGAVREGVLEGNLVIQGRGDPTLVLERVWLLLRRVQQFGVREIRGDIVLDRSAFAPGEASPGDFDGKPLRPYNVQPDALLLNYKAVQLAFTPDAERGVARVHMQPALAGVQVDAGVPLSEGPCNDWRAALQADFTDPARLRLAGRFPLACGQRDWPLAYPEPQRFNARMLEALWLEMGGRLGGTVREGSAPANQAPSFEVESPPLAEVVRDINKFSNNVMAQQLFLTLGLEQIGSGTPQAAHEVLRNWLELRLGSDASGAVLDNGSGLSRRTRVSARLLARLLQHIWSGPAMPELLASLPVSGLDGTMRRSLALPGRAHLKTGSLDGVTAVAGVVLGDSGRRHVLVAIVNHPNAESPHVRTAIDALIAWTAQDQPRGAAGR